MLARKKVADQTPALVTSVSKKIFAHTKTGLVQLQDKIVARFALTIYPYSLGFAHFIKSALTRRENILQHRIHQIQFRRLRTVAHSARASPLVGESE